MLESSAHADFNVRGDDSLLFRKSKALLHLFWDIWKSLHSSAIRIGLSECCLTNHSQEEIQDCRSESYS